MGRDLAKACPRIRKVAEEVIRRAPNELHEDVRITFVDRTMEEQFALYAQGRRSLAEVNLLRKRAGMAPITENANGHKVTWTMASRHITDLHNDDPVDDLSRAVDFGIFEADGSYVDGNTPAEIARYKKLADFVGKVADQLLSVGSIDGGIILGKNFKNPDLPHAEEAKPYSTER